MKFKKKSKKKKKIKLSIRKSYEKKYKSKTKMRLRPLREKQDRNDSGASEVDENEEMFRKEIEGLSERSKSILAHEIQEIRQGEK